MRFYDDEFTKKNKSLVGIWQFLDGGGVTLRVQGSCSVTQVGRTMSSQKRRAFGWMGVWGGG
jgi:hypothetical protein